jgi:rubredoxin
MKKKFICTVCGYVHEGDSAPEKCPQCHVPASKFKELVESSNALVFVIEHEIHTPITC